MAYEQQDNSGSLFKNDRKNKDAHPDYTGSVMIDGVDMWVSAWLKRPVGKKPFMSLAFTPKDVKPAAQQAGSSTPSTRGGFDNFDLDIPF